MPWGTTTWTTPNKPWAVIPAYGWFYGTVFPLAMWAVLRLHCRWPRAPRLALVALVTVPALYAWDLLVEGAAAGLGWWSYTDYVGSALVTAAGNFPLVYPILLNPLFGFTVTALLVWHNESGERRIEQLAGVTRVRPGQRQEVARTVCWAVTLNAAYLVTLVGPIVVSRILWGHESLLVP